MLGIRLPLGPTSAEQVLSNDSDSDGDTSSAILISTRTYGSLALNRDASFAYAPTPRPGFVGTDSFAYQANDGLSDSNIATGNLITMPWTSAVSFTPTDDARVCSKTPTTNYGTSASLEIRTQSKETILSYLKFNITGVTGTIQSARIRLYADKATGDGGAIYRVTGPWTESDRTSADAPSFEGVALSTVAAVGSGTC